MAYGRRDYGFNGSSFFLFSKFSVDLALVNFVLGFFSKA